MQDDDMTTIDAPNRTKPKVNHNETNRARAAFDDYLAMGNGRSLAKLANLYKEQVQTHGKVSVPTGRLATLIVWSSRHNWQARIAQIQQDEADAIAAQRAEARQRIFETGLGNDYERLEALHGVAAIILQALPKSATEARTMSARQLEVLGSLARGMLDDIAREKGERIQRTEINLKAVKAEAGRIAEELGLDPASVMAEAEALLKARQKG